MDIGYAELIPIFLIIIAVIYVATKDTPKRGFGKYQLFFLRIIFFFTFPVGLILYLFLRPKYNIAFSN
jgi:uncharacterized membrane protein